MTNKIGIIGAGVSGLTAAHQLTKLGYEDITIFEAEQLPGGMVESVEIDGTFFELGVTRITRANKILRQVCTDLQVPLNLNNFPKNQLDNLSLEHHLRKHRSADISRELFKYFFDYKNSTPLFRTMSIAEYFSAFEKNGWMNSFILPIFRSYCGPQTYEAIPLHFFFGLFPPTALLPLAASKLGLYPNWVQYEVGGLQNIWKKIAANFDVQYSDPVTRAVQIDKAIEVTAASGKYMFDKLILAVPLKIAQEITQTELIDDIFMQSYSETAFVCRLKQKRALRVAYFSKPKPDGVFWYGNYRSDRPDILVARVDNSSQMPLEKRVTRLVTDMSRVQLHVNDILAVHEWHVTYINSEGAANGLYLDIDKIQGQNGFFFTHGNISGSLLIENSMEHATALIKKHFQAVNLDVPMKHAS